MSDRDHARRRHGSVRASLVAAACLLRGLPRFFRSEPRTPLRVLCIVALDTLHTLRDSRRMPRERITELAALLDFQACTNAFWDRKTFSETEYEAIRQTLENAGLKPLVEDDLGRLRELETTRPSIGGDHRRFDEVRSYREAVVRLSLATLTALALHRESLDEEIRTIQYDSDLDTLFRIAMQCQVIDDVVDYAEDLAAGLPSFLTACASAPLAMQLTASAVRSYGSSRLSHEAVFPLRMALRVVTTLTKVLSRASAVRRRRSRATRQVLSNASR
jgi:hypothetical protein